MMATIGQYEQKISYEKYIDSRFAEFQKAVDKAERTTIERIEGMHHFQDNLKDEMADFVTRDFLDQVLKTLRETNKDKTAVTISVIGIGLTVMNMTWSVGFALFVYFTK